MVGIIVWQMAGTGTAQTIDPSPAQAVAPQPGSISGTVVDPDGAVVPRARVTLTAKPVEGTPASMEAVSGSDGHFGFTNVVPGPFELTVTAQGFAAQKAAGTLQPGQGYVVPDVRLVVATEVDVQVTETQEEIAEEQIHIEETQRVFGVIPNYYVTYVPDAAPLNTRQKFQLAWKSTVTPIAFGISGVIAGIEQADNAFSGYGQGAQGFAKRFGASYADYASGTFLGNAILPALLKQDPRYFYKGTGSKKSRFFYAVANAVICKGDNGHWQPNYSSMLGALAAGGLSNLYYPASDRSGVGLTFKNTAIGIGGSAMGAVIEEFFLRKVTPHANDPDRTGH